MKPPKMNVIPDKKMVKDDYNPKSGKREVDPRPQFSVNADEFPDIKNWSTGQKYMLMVEVEQVGSEIGEWGEDKGKMVSRFKINAIASHNKEEAKEEKEEYSAKYPKAMQEHKMKK